VRGSEGVWKRHLHVKIAASAKKEPGVKKRGAREGLEGRVRKVCDEGSQ